MGHRYPRFVGSRAAAERDLATSGGAYAADVAGSWVRTRARERIGAICAAGLDAATLRRQLLDALREVIDFDAFVWLLTDPITTVGVAPFAEVPCLPELPALIKAKYTTGINRWTDLGRGRSPIGLLREALGGDLARSRVWREVMSRYGIGDVASAVFADQFGCWGFLDLWRGDFGDPFAAGDAQFLDGIAGTVTSGLRRSQAMTFVQAARPHRPDFGPVVLTLDDDLRITSRTSASQVWLDRLLPPVPDERAIPAGVYNVAAQLLATEAGVDGHPASARVHLADGFWLTLRAARLASEPAPGATLSSGAPTIVVTIEEASAAERLDLFARTHGLTPREDELLCLLAVGGDTRAMARQMALSELTVQDHLKSIFSKTGAHDRVGVLSRALGTRRAVSGPGHQPR